MRNGHSTDGARRQAGTPRFRGKLPSVRRTRAWWILRGVLPVVALVLALIAFEAGVGLSQRTGLAQESFPTRVYYAVGLFVLGGLDLGLPAGGPPWARSILWVVYFLAPVITTGVVVEGALRLFRPRWLLRLGLDQHVIVVGAGRLGMLVVETIRERDPHRRIVLVDREAQGGVELALARFGARFVAGDVRSPATLAQLALDRASLAVFATEQDLVNLEAAWYVAAAHPQVRVAAHVGDIGMSRAVAHVQSDAHVHVFNAHRVAAERLYGEHVQAQFASTAARDVVVLAGFGRFGQTILEYLHGQASDELHDVIVVDVAAERRVRLFRAQVPACADRDITSVDGDLDDPSTWERVEPLLARTDAAPVLVLGTDDEAANLRAAVSLRALHPSARIFVRCVYQSAFTNELSRRLGFDVLAVEDILREAIAHEQARWLGE